MKFIAFIERDQNEAKNRFSGSKFLSVFPPGDRKQRKADVCQNPWSGIL
jgi:hypothetical protein